MSALPADDETIDSVPSGNKPPPSIPMLTILAHPDLCRIGEVMYLDGLFGGRETYVSRSNGRFGLPQEDRTRTLATRRLSRDPVGFQSIDGNGMVITGYGDSVVSLDGRSPKDSVRVDLGALRRGVIVDLNRGSVVLLLHRKPTRPRVRLGPNAEQFLVGEGDAINQVRSQIAALASDRGHVLLRGETGTGKEVVAKAIGEIARSRPFVTMNASAIPATLAEAELFGIVKGAASDVKEPRPGVFERAHGGILFLDELGDIDLAVQPKVLRVLQSGEVSRVGALGVTSTYDVRVVAATNKDLEAEVSRGTFRRDLLERLKRHVITLPALRDRREDIGRLVVHFLENELTKKGRLDLLTADPPGREAGWFPGALIADLVLYDWPGNVRELELAVARIVDHSVNLPQAELDSDTMASLSKVLAASARSNAAVPSVTERTTRTTEQILAVYEKHERRIGPTAAELGIRKSRLYDILEASGLSTGRSLSPEQFVAAYRECGCDDAATAKHLGISSEAVRIRRKTMLPHQ